MTAHTEWTKNYLTKKEDKKMEKVRKEKEKLFITLKEELGKE